VVKYELAVSRLQHRDTVMLVIGAHPLSEYVTLVWCS